MFKLFTMLGLFSVGIIALIYHADGKVFPYQYKTETFPNGLKVIMIPMPSNGIVSYYTIVRTGSRDEYEPNHTGFAHFFEHMMFRGTKKYPGSVYDSLITSLGANANAYTTDDYTCYHLNFASEDLEKVMELESDRFQNLFYEEPDFQTESGAVYGEYKKSKTDPFFLLFEKIQETAFDKHTYKHTTMGFEKDIKSMPQMYEYSQSFFRRYYKPDNCVLLVVGDIKYDNIKNLVKKYYGNWQKGYVNPTITAEPEQIKERIAKVNYPGKSLPILTLSYKSPAFNPKDRITVASYLFGELAFGENSDIYKKLYLNEQKVQFIASELERNRDPFLWIIFSMIKNEKDIGYVQDEINKTIEKFKKEKIDKSKLDNLKKRIKYGFLMNLDTPEKVAGGLARTIALSGGIESLEDYFATIEQITPDDIMNAAAKYFIPEKRTIVTLTGSK
jgi:zinc protease